MDKNRPQGREKNTVSGQASVNKRGSGLGTGPVGNAGSLKDRKPGQNAPQNARPQGGRATGSPSSGGQSVRAGGGLDLKKILLIAVLLIVVYFIYTKFIAGSDGIEPIDYSNQIDYSAQSSGGNTSVNASDTNLDTSVASGTRDRYTSIKGGGEDTVTIMLYMCGTDLESKNSMATNDLNEMMAATISDKVNLIVFTGGCKKWKTSGISNSVNQIYQVKSGSMTCLESNMGSDSMTKPATLTSFIKYCKNNYAADRYELIFWDHGGGSLSGYGYDENHKKDGSMTLAGINTALKDAGVKFDIIGFDACLMATVENGIMLSQYGDYMVASEETEPGIGWYYTNWLTKLSGNTSMDTTEIGKNIIDDFINVCSSKYKKPNTTLSLVDLAELANTVPSKLSAFSSATNELIQNNEYTVVSNARNNTKEFAESSEIDQIDAVDFARKLGSSEGDALASALSGAVKYNRTSSEIRNAYGLSIYFPYSDVSNVDTAIETYKLIGMDGEYTKCIKEFAALETGGQISAGGSSASFTSLLGSILGDGSTGSALDVLGGFTDYSTGGSSSAISSLLGSVVSGGSSSSAALDILGGFGGLGGLGGSSLDFLTDSFLGSDKAVTFLSNNYFDDSNLSWTKESGEYKLKMSDEQWNLIQDVALNVFYDDGAGYIDLGIDNVYDFDDDGNLVSAFNNDWLSIDGQIVPYYYLSTMRDGSSYSISGYVPCLLNGERVELMLVFDNAHPEGYIAGAQPVYKDGETATASKGMLDVNAGDKLDFICDYYSYSGEYQDSYYLGETMTLSASPVIGNIRIDGTAKGTYRLTDIYHQNYWTPVLP